MAYLANKSTTRDPLVFPPQRTTVCSIGLSPASHHFEAWSLQENYVLEIHNWRQAYLFRSAGTDDFALTASTSTLAHLSDRRLLATKPF